ncbi:MAG: hypothetical protein HFF50_10890 [Lawsonibacter sp.]|nr:hypothetical protein [Lawsonibacter sp.]
MKRNIADLLDQYPAEEMELGGSVPYSPSRIKELTMHQIETTHAKRTQPPFRPVRLLAAAAAVAALTVTTFAAGRLMKAGGLFQDFFAPEDGTLSQGQVDAIDRLGQVFGGEGGNPPAPVTSNGATITPVAALADENVYYLRLRVEAPEGTALPNLDGEHYYQFFGNAPGEILTLEPAPGHYSVFGYNVDKTVLPDDNPEDNRKEFVLCFSAQHGAKGNMKFNDGISKVLTIYGLWIQDARKGYTPVFTGAFQFDIGQNFQSQTIQLDTEGLTWTDERLDYTNTLEEMTLSPLSVSYRYSTTLPENKYFGPDVSIAIVLKDGTRFVPGFDSTQEIVDYLKGYYNAEPEDILPLPGIPGADQEGYFAFDEPLDLSQVDYVMFGDTKIPVTVE